MENKEVLEALEEFAKHPAGKISHVLEQYLCRIASTGVTLFPWNKLKPLLIHKLDTVIQDFQERCPMSQQSTSPNIEHVSFDVMRKRLIDDINQFNGIPFTIQRLCELVTNSTKHYQRTDKYMRGVEKNLVVVTIVDPYGNRIVNENKVEMNGIEVSSSLDHLCQSDVLSSPFLPPPVPVNSPNTSSTGSWFSSLSNVVDSPSSYPNWNNQETEALEASTQKNTRTEDSSDSREPPRKMLRLDEAEVKKEERTDSSVFEEHKAIAPLLTQLLSHSGITEQAAQVQDEKNSTTCRTQEPATTDEQISDADEQKIGTHETEQFPGCATDNTNVLAIAAENSSEAVASADDDCDSTMTCSRDNNVDLQSSGENHFSDSFVTTSDDGAVVTTRCADTLPSNADSSGLQVAQHDYSVLPDNIAKQRSTDFDTAAALPTSEWSNLDDSCGDIDSASNADAECGVDSLLETSDVNMSFGNSESCDFASSPRAEEEQELSECEATSEAQMAGVGENNYCDSGPANHHVAQEEDEELEQVGSSLSGAASSSPMDAD